LNILEVLRQTAGSIAAHKLRSFLTMFGIIWGITSVILLVGLGKGFNRDQKERLKTIGVDLAVIWGGRTSEQAGGYAAGRPVRLSIEDAYLLKNEAYLLRTVSPELRRSVSEVSRYNAASRPVRGVWPDYQRFRSLRVQEGRLMTDDDEKDARRVVVLGVESRDQLFPGQPAIGETLTMNGSPYTVIGVLEKKKQNGSYGSGPDNTQLFVPYSSMARDSRPRNGPVFPKAGSTISPSKLLTLNIMKKRCTRSISFSGASTTSIPQTKMLSSSGIRSTVQSWWSASSAS